VHTVSSQVDKLLGQILATGAYNDPDAVLVDALHQLLQRQEDVKAIQRGLDDVAAGRTKPWREAIDDARQRHALSHSKR
jgi:predicted transcriptional regulator